MYFVYFVVSPCPGPCPGPCPYFVCFVPFVVRALLCVSASLREPALALVLAFRSTLEVGRSTLDVHLFTLVLALRWTLEVGAFGEPQVRRWTFIS